MFNIKNQKPVSHKVLDIIEADKFYVDLNDNGKIDSGELIKLKDIIAFSPNKNYYTESKAQKLSITLEQYLINGFIARKWARENLLGKDVQVIFSDEYNKTLNYHYAKVIFNDEDLAKTLLKSGLAFLWDKTFNGEYIQLQNLKQSKLNAAELSKLNFVLLNNKNNTIHKLSCEYAFPLSDATLILEQDAKNYIPCKICFKISKDSALDDIEIPKSSGVYEKSVYRKFGNIELFLINPLVKKRPDSGCNTDICKAIVKEIDLTKNSIDIALFGIGEQNDVINALKRAKERGVEINSVINMSSDANNIYPFSRQFCDEFSCRENNKSAIMHNKFFIFDNKKVLTGSANLSPTDTGGYSANIAVLVDSSSLAEIFKKEFNQMLQGKFSISKAKIETTEIKISDSTIIKPHFCPKGNVLEEVFLPLIKNANSEIFVSIFYLTHKDVINELIEAKRRGVNVLVLIDALGAINFKDRLNLLREAKIPVIIENWGGKNHEKTIMVDSKYLLLGSSNFSQSGFNKNNENIIVIENSEIAELYRDYYLYLFNSIDRKFLKFFPRAESKESVNSCNDGIDNNFDGKIDNEDDGCK